MLKNTHLALVATVHKLYAMVRSGQPWDLGEPDLNDRGQPVLHTIASNSAAYDRTVIWILPKIERDLQNWCHN